MLHLPALGAELSELSQEQADYIDVGVKGPFKNEPLQILIVFMFQWNNRLIDI